MTLIQATHADVDGDGRPELIVLGRVGNLGTAILRVNILTFVNSQWVKIGTFDCNSAGDHVEYEFATLSAGDVDGDGREEIIVAGTLFQDSWVRIYEDPIQAGGFGTIAHEFTFPQTTEVRAIAAQLDDDGEMEMVIWERPLAGTPAAYVFDDAQTGYAPLLSVPLFSGNDMEVELVAMNRDADARDEIAAVRRVSSTSLVVQIFDDAIAGFPLIRTYDPMDPGNLANPIPRRVVQAGDIDGDGLDDLVVLVARKDAFDSYLDLRVYWGNGAAPTTTTFTDWSPYVLKYWDLALADRDSDGKMEVVLGYVVALSSGAAIEYVGVQTFDATSPTKLKTTPGGTAFFGHPASPIALAGDDFDMDGVRMRWKGVKFLKLPDPNLMVVLAAPPTKKGITQNYSSSEMSYTKTQGYSTSYEVTTGITISLSAGFEGEDPTGWFSGGFKASIKSQLELSVGVSQSVQTSTSFTGGYDQDVVIFEGTLHMIYVYEYVASQNPDLIGTETTINVPVDTKIYKWTRQFYDDTFGSSAQLPADLFTHTIGNPASYPKHSDAKAILSNHDGFEGDSVTVGQGKGTNGLGLSMETCLTDTVAWTVELEFEADGKVAGVTFGKSWAMSDKFAWSLSTSKGTDYEAKIGDIQLSGDYFTWGYDAGIFIYRRTDEGKNPYQVLSFWTHPWGSGY
jgi:hypothetical protein